MKKLINKIKTNIIQKSIMPAAGMIDRFLAV